MENASAYSPQWRTCCGQFRDSRRDSFTELDNFLISFTLFLSHDHLASSQSHEIYGYLTILRSGFAEYKIIMIQYFCFLTQREFYYIFKL